MSSELAFCPNWASAPGDTIADILAERHLPVEEFSKRMDHSQSQTDDLIHGRLPMTIGMARRLGEVLGASVAFWMSRDFHYRETVARAREEDREWLRALPIGDMTKFRWIKPSRPSEELAESLRFFDVPSVQVWHERYSNVEQLAAFRTSKSIESSPAAVAAWLRQGEREAEQVECAPWNRERFHECLESVRALTRQKDPKRFIPQLRKLCAACGVAVVVVRYPSGCRASGAARFLSPDKALLQFSFRHLTDDQFWFTFFHEAAHLLLHPDKGLFVDGIDDLPSVEEHEADDFSARVLIPIKFQSDFARVRLSSTEIIRFAVRAGVAPGIVVGQLQHGGQIGHNQFNGLKRRYEWSEWLDRPSP